MPSKKHSLPGDFAVIEDNRIVLYHTNRDALRGYGVVNIDRYPTDLRASQFDREVFPAPCEYGGRGWSIIFQIGGRPVKHQVSPDYINYSHGSSEKRVLEEKDLTSDEINNRWRYIRSALNAEGKLVVVFARSKMPKSYKKLLATWSEAILRGASEDNATEVLYQLHGIDLTNDFLAACSTPKRAYGCPSDSLFVLDGMTSKNHVPLAYAGTLPNINWDSANY